MLDKSGLCSNIEAAGADPLGWDDAEGKSSAIINSLWSSLGFISAASLRARRPEWWGSKLAAADPVPGGLWQDLSQNGYGYLRTHHDINVNML